MKNEPTAVWAICRFKLNPARTQWEVSRLEIMM